MKKILKNLSIISLFVALFTAFNANALENVAIIDIDQISKDAKVVKYIAKKISKQRDRYQKEISKKEKGLEKEKEKIEAKKSILSQEALEKQQKKFIEKVRDLKEFAAKRDKTLKSAYSESIKKVNEKVGEIVSEIAQEQELALVLPASQVVYSLDSLDITAQVIEKLDKKMSRVKVRFK